MIGELMKSMPLFCKLKQSDVSPPELANEEILLRRPITH